MEVATTNSVLNSGITRNSNNGAGSEAVNAYGIGRENQPKVELSPQARILQQTEQNQRQNQPSNNETKAEEAPQGGDDFVRVSSSVGRTSQSGNLSSEEALDLYRSIEKLL